MSALDKVDMLFRLLEKKLFLYVLSLTPECKLCFLSPSGLELLAIKPSSKILFDSNAANGPNIIIMDYKRNDPSSINQMWFLNNPASNITAIVSRSTDDSTKFVLDGGAMTKGTQLQLSAFNSRSPKQSHQWKRNRNCWQLARFGNERGWRQSNSRYSSHSFDGKQTPH